MNPQLTLLIKLGDLEAKLAEQEARRRAIPEEMEELKSELTRLRSVMVDKDKKLDELRHDRRLVEQDVEDEKYSLGKHRVQLLQLKTNREYEAMEHEIAGGETKISKLEDKILELMESDDELTTSLQDDKSKYAGREKDVEGQNRELEVESQEVEARIAELSKSIGDLTEGIDKSLYREYQRVRDGKDNNQAITSITPKGACGGCYSSLTLQRINEVKMGDKITTCYHCGRILYHIAD
ncbi:zinc ribbon domain-containing protein [candidate division KSB1 bacterium]